MGKGFFKTESAPSKAPIPLLPRCGVCNLYRYCKSPKMPVDGKGHKGILVIGEGPGFNESEQGKPFVGKSGQLLWEILSKYGVEREDCWITNAVICRPTRTENGKILNRTPTPKEIEYCRPNVVNTIKELKPDVVVLLGASAVKSVLGWLWKEEVGQISQISRWDGWRIPDMQINAWVAPTFHPSYVMRPEEGEVEREAGADKDEPLRKILFSRHLEAACKLRGKPWPNGPPDYRSKVKIILDPKEAAKQIMEIAANSGEIAFDYENSPLKPQRKDAFIYCCSVSDGRTAIAYPWTGEAIDATKEILRWESVGKIASNMKHEEGWSRRFGFEVRNWVWDTMVAAHVLDNRPSISSIKFQAYCRLGQPAWEAKIKPYFKSKGSNEHNRIKEANLTEVLRYCGMDSLMEYKVAKLQMKEMERRSNGK